MRGEEDACQGREDGFAEVEPVPEEKAEEAEEDDEEPEGGVEDVGRGGGERFEPVGHLRAPDRAPDRA